MKRIAVTLLLLSYGWAGAVHGEVQPLAELLKDALFAEEADRDLAKAEKGYREILQRFDGERAYAATAMLRLGEVLRQRGELEEAEKLYSRVLREFGDQEAVAKVAKARLGSEAADIGGGAEKAQLERLREMLAESPDLLNATVGGLTPLERAARDGETEVVKYLLSKGAAMDDDRGPYKLFTGNSKILVTAIGRAVAGSHSKTVDVLIEAGATLDDGLLHTAAETGNLAITRSLLAAGVDVNTRFGCDAILRHLDKQGAPSSRAAGRRIVLPPGRGSAPSEPSPIWNLTALEVAAYRGFGEVARLLIENGAEVGGRDGEPSAALHYAIRKGDAALAGLLLDKGAEANGAWEKTVQGYSSFSPLAMAGSLGHGEIVKLLLAAGADLATKDKYGRTALHHAHGDVVPLLIEAGADVNAVDPDGLTPLFLTRSGTEAAAKTRALLAAGADVNAVAGQGRTPLFYAIEYDSAAVAKLMIEAGADVSHASDFGTPLAVAAHASPELIRLLIGAGAAVNRIQANGCTALHAAVSALNAAGVRELLNAGANPNLHGEVASPPITALVQRMNGQDSGQQKSLGAQFDAVLRLLVQEGADPNAILDGQTVLHVAARVGLAETVDYLLANGASATAGKEPAYKSVESLGPLSTTLSIAARLQAKDRPRIIQASVRYGGKPFAEIGAAFEDGEELPPCPHTLFEIFMFYTRYVSSDGEVKIWSMGEDEPRVIKLGELINAADPAGDVPLQWGDVVHFTKSGDDGQPPITDAARQMLEKHLARSVEFVWNDEAGAETRRQKIRFFPGWRRATEGGGWLPGSANSYQIVEGATEVAVLPNLERLSWIDGDAEFRPQRWLVTRKGEGGQSRTFGVEHQQSLAATALPEDGDVIVPTGKPVSVIRGSTTPSGARVQRIPKPPR